ncbi:MAG: hypothetical protein ACKPKO_47335 [Candidatus Fonsibacter sp.]
MNEGSRFFGRTYMPADRLSTSQALHGNPSQNAAEHLPREGPQIADRRTNTSPEKIVVDHPEQELVVVPNQDVHICQN